MPREYLDCVREKRVDGMSLSESKKTCAIAYYKKYGKTPEEAAKEKASEKSVSFSQDEMSLMKMDESIIKSNVRMYAPIQKVDEERRMVFGYATTDSLDSQGERISLDATFEAVEEYADWRSLKEMHRPETAAGTVPVIERHTGIGLYVGAEVVDDNAWKKVLKGVYKGFSIGGYCLEKDGDTITKYRLLEISLVDRMANPDALFVVAKRHHVNPSDTEADTGGNSMKKNGTEPQKTEAKPEEKKDNPPEEKKEEPVKTETKVEEKTTDVKEESKDAEAQKSESAGDMKKKIAELEAELKKKDEQLQKQNDAKNEIIKLVGELRPELKKSIDAQEEKSPEQVEREKLSKMSLGELTALMMKQAKATNE